MKPWRAWNSLWKKSWAWSGSDRIALDLAGGKLRVAV